MSSRKSKISQSLEQVYARALLEMAEQAGRVDETTEELYEIGRLFESQPQLQRLLSSRVVSAAERARSVEAIFKGRVSDLIYRFMQVANKKDRLGDLPGIIRAYTQLMDQKLGVTEAEVYVAKRLSASQTLEVADQLSRIVGRNVLLHQHVDPGLIGGVKIRLGDRLIDGSVSTQLRIMRDRLMAVGSDRVRENVEKVLAGS